MFILVLGAGFLVQFSGEEGRAQVGIWYGVLDLFAVFEPISFFSLCPLLMQMNDYETHVLTFCSMDLGTYVGSHVSQV